MGNNFAYVNNVLYAEHLSVTELANKIDTPFYCYSASQIQENYQRFALAFKSMQPLICFAVKANSNIAVLKILAELGAGADCVSQGEVIRALHAGIPASKIIFSGVGKTREEMRYAIDADIAQFNVESEAELYVLNEVAASLHKRVRVALRINPDVDSQTHHKITTGKKDNKFGILWSDARAICTKAKDLSYIDIVGISIHIGSQILQLGPFIEAFRNVAQFAKALKADGHNIRTIDLGGGIGVPYTAEEKAISIEDYAQIAMDVAKDLECQLVLEPGRYIVADAGLLVIKVLYLKNVENKQIVITDGGMNDLIRQSLYGSYHEIIPVLRKTQTDMISGDIVGPVCESSDTFATAISLPPLTQGDLLAIKTVGAYGAVMSSTYNSRLLVPELMVKGSNVAIIRDRPNYEDMLRTEHIPAWLTK